jgi:hypothetical protein
LESAKMRGLLAAFFSRSIGVVIFRIRATFG